MLLTGDIRGVSRSIPRGGGRRSAGAILSSYRLYSIGLLANQLLSRSR